MKREVSLQCDPRPLELQKTTFQEINRLKQRLESLPTPVAFSHIIENDQQVPQSALLPLIPRSSKFRVQAELMKEPQSSLYIKTADAFEIWHFCL